MQGHAEGLEARAPRPAGSPRRALPQHPSRVPQRETQHTPRADRGGTAGSAGPPYLDDGRAGGGGVRIRFRAPRRPPSPRAQSHRLLPHSLAGGAGGRGRSLAQPRPRTPGPPLLLHSPRRAPGPPGLASGRTHRRALAAVIGAGSPATG